MNQPKKTADQLIKSGKATYPFLGVSLDMNYSGVGALVANSGTSILPGGPAAKAGIRAGDLIIKFENKAIDSPEQLSLESRISASRKNRKFRNSTFPHQTIMDQTTRIIHLMKVPGEVWLP